MTATDELRRLLDERGVEWKGFEGDPLGFVKAETAWGEVDGFGNYNYWVAEYFDGTTLLNIGNPTPAQAVEATLGSDLKAENDKLREELAKWERLTAGINLPDYPVSQFVPKDIERENAKLRELVRDMWSDGMCECDEREACATCEYGYLDRMRELGIEVDA